MHMSFCPDTPILARFVGSVAPYSFSALEGRYDRDVIPLARLPVNKPHPHAVRTWCGGSCTSTLRIIRATQKPATMPPLHHHLRGHRHGTNPLFLRTRARCSGVGM